MVFKTQKGRTDIVALYLKSDQPKAQASQTCMCQVKEGMTRKTALNIMLKIAKLYKNGKLDIELV